MKYRVEVLIQGTAWAEVEASSDKEAIKKAMELKHNDFAIDYAALDYDSSPKYREVFNENGDKIK